MPGKTQDQSGSSKLTQLAQLSTWELGICSLLVRAMNFASIFFYFLTFLTILNTDFAEYGH